MILDIRGTHGSGKTTVIRNLLADQPCDNEPILDGHSHLGYRLKRYKASILGKYETACGGCDGIKTAEEVGRRVRLFASEYSHVLLEGILVAHTFQRYSDLANELGNYTFLFLDTPLETCIQRVQDRRKEAGNSKPLNPKNIVKDWHCIWERRRPQFIEAGHHVIVLDHKDPMPMIYDLLK